MGAIEPQSEAVVADGEPTAAAASERRLVQRFGGGASAGASDDVAVEVPVAFEYNGISHAVMLATPADLHDFAIGFSLSEGIARPSQCYGVEASEGPAGITLAIEIASAAFARLRQQRRTLAGRTGCGICGAESLEQVLRPLPDLTSQTLRIAPAALARAHAHLAGAQPLQHRTGAAHGAVWCGFDGAIVCAREDVGRHNALDKLIGALARGGFETRGGFALVTSRASVEMVQKSATAGIAVLAAVSAPTALAVQAAASCGQTLVGFVRGQAFNVYTHPGRIAG
jgi:FdhD protein